MKRAGLRIELKLHRESACRAANLPLHVRNRIKLFLLGKVLSEGQLVVNPAGYDAAFEIINTLPSGSGGVRCIKETRLIFHEKGTRTTRSQHKHTEIEALRNIVMRTESPLELYPSGCLFHGPPGVGKTWLVRGLVRDVAARWPTKLFVVKPSTVYAAPSLGASERYIRKVFSSAHRFANESGGVGILFLMK